MTPREIWSNYIRYIGAGAVTLGGAATLIRTLPTIIGAFRESYRDLMRSGAAGSASAMQMRTERDIPITYVVLGSLVLVFLIAAITYLSFRRGAFPAWGLSAVERADCALRVFLRHRLLSNRGAYWLQLQSHIWDDDRHPDGH